MNTGNGNDEKIHELEKPQSWCMGSKLVTEHKITCQVYKKQEGRRVKYIVMNNHYFDWSKNIESFSPASSFDVYLTQPDGYESIK